MCGVVSIMAKFYDPLGVASLMTVISWDEPLVGLDAKTQVAPVGGHNLSMNGQL